mmetsp:Transcript_110871/g.320441  ORF Transcript_110871/g.320441 Transcript_110871/m.320441 type:complete len:400 (-) Transcript_110871:547-1746(-)
MDEAIALDGAVRLDLSCVLRVLCFLGESGGSGQLLLSRAHAQPSQGLRRLLQRVCLGPAVDDLDQKAHDVAGREVLDLLAVQKHVPAVLLQDLLPGDEAIPVFLAVGLDRSRATGLASSIIDIGAVGPSHRIGPHALAAGQCEVRRLRSAFVVELHHKGYGVTDTEALETVRRHKDVDAIDVVQLRASDEAIALCLIDLFDEAVVDLRGILGGLQLDRLCLALLLDLDLKLHRVPRSKTVYFGAMHKDILAIGHALNKAEAPLRIELFDDASVAAVSRRLPSVAASARNSASRLGTLTVRLPRLRAAGTIGSAQCRSLRLTFGVLTDPEADRVAHLKPVEPLPVYEHICVVQLPSLSTRYETVPLFHIERLDRPELFRAIHVLAVSRKVVGARQCSQQC